MKALIFAIFGLGLCLQLLSAQSMKAGAFDNRALFGIEFERDDQEFYGRVDRVNSVSLQHYVTGTYRVHEMVIDMAASSVQLRIYHMGLFDPSEELKNANKLNPLESVRLPEYNTPSQINKARETVNKATAQALMKEYPVTTHAKTIEFRVHSKENLIWLYTHFRDLWIRAESGADEVEETVKGGGVEITRLNGTLFVL